MLVQNCLKQRCWLQMRQRRNCTYWHTSAQTRTHTYTEWDRNTTREQPGLRANMKAANTHLDTHPHFSVPSYPLNPRLPPPQNRIAPSLTSRLLFPTLTQSSWHKDKMTGCINIYTQHQRPRQSSVCQCSKLVLSSAARPATMATCGSNSET